MEEEGFSDLSLWFVWPFLNRSLACVCEVGAADGQAWGTDPALAMEEEEEEAEAGRGPKGGSLL